MSDIAVQTTLTTTTCAVCGMLFAVPEHWLQKHCREQGEGFHCPAGHALTFGKSELSKARDELVAVKREKERQEALKVAAQNDRDAWERRADKEERAARRLRQRVHGGKCPCCKRNFKALRLHMSVKHPDYAKV